jgi:hypothetical protein
MADRTLLSVCLAALILTGCCAAGRADVIPAPTVPLKDYDGRGVFQIDIPALTESAAEGGPSEGGKVIQPGITTWFHFRQTYVRPDRVRMELGFGTQRNQVGQIMLAQGATERTYYPGNAYAIERSYKNLEQAQENPINAVGMAMFTYARVLREVESAKLLPEEDLDKLKESHTQRLAELAALRKELAASKELGNLPKAAAAAAESARLGDDLKQIEFRRANPCYVVEFPNKDLLGKLFGRGLVGTGASELLKDGKTTAWITRAEGLPIRLETTANDGRVAVYACFTDLKINIGMHPAEVVLGAPPGVRLFSAVADLKDPSWEEKMDAAINAQIEKLEEERRRLTQPRPQAPRKRRK